MATRSLATRRTVVFWSCMQHSAVRCSILQLSVPLCSILGVWFAPYIGPHVGAYVGAYVGVYVDACGGRRSLMIVLLLLLLDLD